MADALDIKREYAYTEWAWFPPEDEKLPSPTDWEENDKSRKQQAHRWEIEQERKVQELRKNHDTLKQQGL